MVIYRVLKFHENMRCRLTWHVAALEYWRHHGKNNSACLVAGGVFHGRAVLMRKTLFYIILLPLLTVAFWLPAHGKNYSSLLVHGLIRLGYPLDRAEVVAIDNISMRFDTRNRIDVLDRILQDRQAIHALQTGDIFLKTGVIIAALRLLDELDLPVSRRMIAQFVKEQGWEARERRLLSYMAAKRDIDFASHVTLLLNALTRGRSQLEQEWGDEISLAIMDTCDNLSFLTDLFIYRGDRRILEALINYAGQAYGYPKEYLSHMLMAMFLQRPGDFVEILAAQNDQKANVVVNSLVFAIWTKDTKGNVEQLLREELAGETYATNRIVNMLRERLESLSTNESGNRKPLSGH